VLNTMFACAHSLTGQSYSICSHVYSQLSINSSPHCVHDLELTSSRTY